MSSPPRADAPTGALPRYRGLEWTGDHLPTRPEPWPAPPGRLAIGPKLTLDEVTADRVRAYVSGMPWVCPGRTHYFFCDMHADADAFLLSLVASGGVERTGSGDFDFRLTEEGSEAVFVIGGDCFDKGPHVLRLLDVLAKLRDTGAEVELLAGNDDLRTLTGIALAGAKDPRRAHLFVRMGKKTVPLLKEVHDRCVRPGSASGAPLSDAAVREHYFPGEDWYRDFPDAVRGIIPDGRIEREMRRIREKTDELVARSEELGLSLGMLHEAVQASRDLFMSPSGEFHWFFDEMHLVRRAGSYLLLHAGLDDEVAERYALSGDDGVNAWFHDTLRSDLFGLYHGPLGNVFRTKYREYDLPLTERGVQLLNRAGIDALVHGHRNILCGQRVVMRCGLLNFECDASVDRNTRAVEGLSGPGGAVTIFRADGRVLGISTDYPRIRVFDPARLGGLLTIV